MADRATTPPRGRGRGRGRGAPPIIQPGGRSRGGQQAKHTHSHCPPSLPMIPPVHHHHVAAQRSQTPQRADPDQPPSYPAAGPAITPDSFMAEFQNEGGGEQETSGLLGPRPPLPEGSLHRELPALPTNREVQLWREQAAPHNCGRENTSEFERTKEALFAAYDDGSGSLDRNEVARMLSHALKGKALVNDDYLKACLDCFDTNGDGKIDREEYNHLYEVVHNHINGTYDKLEAGEIVASRILCQMHNMLGDTSALDFEDDLKSVLVEAPEGCSFTAKIIAGMFGLLLLVFGAAIIIAALTGYFDSHCSKSACQNSSPCIELENSYTCSCLAGFSGASCEVDVDECASEPCRHGATCSTAGLVAGYNCSCAPGYQDEICSSNIDDCLSAHCINGAYCVDGLTDFTCVCAQGFTGTLCEIPPHVRTQFHLNLPVGETNETVVALLVSGLGRSADYVHNVQLRPVYGNGIASSVHLRDDLIFTLESETIGAAASAVGEVVNGAGVPNGWKLQATNFEGCSIEAAESVIDRAVLPTHILQCIQTYGWPMPLPIDVDVYLLEDLSSSFDDDKENLAALAEDITATIDAMFGTYRLGIGSFVDVNGPYCYENHNSLTESMSATAFRDALVALEVHPAGGDCGRLDTVMTEGIPFDTNETCRYEGSPFTFNFSTSSCFLERVDGPDAGDNSGEASLMGLEQVGLQASALGFVSEYLRVVVLSTDDAYKSPGFEFCECTSDHVPREHDCSCPNACTSAHCSRVPTLPEVRSALHDSRVTPIFAVAPLETSTDENRESNADILRQKYRDADLGGVVVELSQDSSNFIDVLVVGLGQILAEGTATTDSDGIPFPDECLPADECQPNPCRHGAACTDGPYHAHVCECTSGYTGKNCELQVDFCCSFPCANGGTCANTGATPETFSYECDCSTAAGFTGNNCMEDADECTSSPCQNGATCSESTTDSTIPIDDYTCDCIAGFAGLDCEVDIDECASIPCRNGAECRGSPPVSPDTFQCTCEAGYEGATCSGSVNPCDSLVGRDACDPEFATCVHTGPGTSRCDCDPDMHTDDAGQHCSDDFPIVLVLVLIGLFLLLLGILLFIIWFLKRKNSVIVIVETLDRDETMTARINLECKMSRNDSVSQLKQQIFERIQIPLAEQRLFFAGAVAGSGGDHEEHDLVALGTVDSLRDPDKRGDSATLAECGMVNARRFNVKIMQSWELLVHDTVKDEAVGALTVERHWRVISVKLKIEDATGIEASSMKLSYDGTLLSDNKRLPDYPKIVNGSKLQVFYDAQEEEDFDTIDEQQMAPVVSAVGNELEASKKSQVFNSVLTMAQGFETGKAPGSHLSDLQERAFIKRRAKKKRTSFA